MKTTQSTETKAITKEVAADNNLLVEERRRHIRELVAERGRITVSELVTMFDISQVTVRSDLKSLAAPGDDVRTRVRSLAPRADAD